MAHIQTKYIKLWKPQNLAVDKISSQRMFIDNIDLMEEFALSVLKNTSAPVASLAELRSINTSDVTLYTDGTTIMVKSNGLYFFDRTSEAIDDGKKVIAPTVGGGKWISAYSFLNDLAFKDSVTAADVGLGNVPNVSTNNQTPTYTQASTLATLVSGEKLSVSFGKIMKGLTDLISHLANKSNPHGTNKTQVGLGNVDNTSDADKPVSTAQLTAIIDAKKAGTDAQTSLNAHKNNTSNPHGVTKTQIGLGNIDNTADIDKPVSTAQATAIADAKKSGADAQSNLTTHTNNTSNPHNVTKSQIGLGNVPNVTTNNQTPTYTQASTLTNLTSGEAISVSFGKIMKGLADLISHLANKSNPHSVTKTQIGLGNVDNTSDADKPVSTAVQTQLNNKAPSKFISANTEVNSWNALNTAIDNILINDMVNNSIKHVSILLTADIGPFYHGGSVHFTIHRVNENYGYVIASKYASSPNEVRFYSRCKAIGGWGDWITYPAVSGVASASVEE